jgi:protein O-mannosyl-transferase
LPFTSEDQASDSRGFRLLLLALLVTTLAYLATLHFGFVYDDEPQIVLNTTLTTWKTLPTLFLAHSWKFLLPDWAGNYYRPVFMTWLLVNRMIIGLNPVYWHATTVLLHLIATAMAYVVARQLMHNSVRAGFVALLFGLHPIHIETVAWVSGVTDSLMAIFAFAAFWAWVKGERSPDQLVFYRVLAAIMFALACLTKETALFLPIVIIAYDVIFARDERTWAGLARSAIRVWPLWAIAAAYLVARAFALRGLIHSGRVPLLYNVLTTPTILWGYMRRLVWPVRMTVFYDTPPVTSVLQWRFWLPVLAWVVVLILAWRIAKRSRMFAISVVWIFVFLAPAILGLPAFMIGEWVHDRYLYLPSFGFCLLLVHLVSQLPSRRDLFGLPAAPTAVVLVIAAAMSFATAWEQTYWANGFLLFARGVNISPRSSWAKSHLGNELLRMGDRENAERQYREALSIEPDNWKNNVAFGLVLYYTGQYKLADEQLSRSSALMPNDSNQYFYQGLCRFNLGNFTGAEDAFRKSLKVDSRRPRYHFWLGFALEKQGRIDEARKQFETELKEHPDTDTLAADHLRKFAADSSKK